MTAYNNSTGAAARAAAARGELITFTVDPLEDAEIEWCEWWVGAGSLAYPRTDRHPEAVWNTAEIDGGGEHTIRVTVHYRGEEISEVLTTSFYIRNSEDHMAVIRGIADHAVDGIRDALANVSVGLRRTSSTLTPDVGLWMLIKRMARELSFNEYRRAIDSLLCAFSPDADGLDELAADDRLDSLNAAREREDLRFLHRRRFLPFNDTDAYRFLKVATEAFLLSRIGITRREDSDNATRLVDVFAMNGMARFTGKEIDEAASLLSTPDNHHSIRETLHSYLESVGQLGENGQVKTIPYLALVSQGLQDTGMRSRYLFPGESVGRLPDECFAMLQEKLTQPLLLELIWSYWHEEGMLVQTIGAVTRRFQNIRGPGERDPLSEMQTSPLRPLNNLLWGYIQDEQHQLSIVRRAYEYENEYGMSLYGQAVPTLRPADSRSRFLEAFHHLLYRVTQFYQQDDDTTVASDGFPVLNALREVHLVLSEGAHNQFGDLPSTARQEMFIQQWLLARPEFQQFLPKRAMIAYPEEWMGRVDAMKGLQGWTDTSVLQFHNLAVYGEQILLSIRYTNWNDPNLKPDDGKNWARMFRPEIQGYIHAYRATTSVDLTAEATDTRAAEDRALQPSVHLRRMLEQQRRGAPLPARVPLPELGGRVGQPAANGAGPGVKRRLPAAR
ncbi:MAG: hypothetical protein JOZ87_10310 [Chloroflexi bacterium]|nr:hypothetical protein [Chloroflexota bacterium]